MPCTKTCGIPLKCSSLEHRHRNKPRPSECCDWCCRRLVSGSWLSHGSNHLFDESGDFFCRLAMVWLIAHLKSNNIRIILVGDARVLVYMIQELCGWFSCALIASGLVRNTFTIFRGKARCLFHLVQANRFPKKAIGVIKDLIPRSFNLYSK